MKGVATRGGGWGNEKNYLRLPDLGLPRRAEKRGGGTEGGRRQELEM